ncbi:hypothetical protein ZEAMMB73_Zm00001d047480 [Zea mays]|uniref:Beta-amylase n=3 Tax=Zea mays TaxID=4577 RepID=A0A1D6PAC1_MAIZE|nr:hypothetical protein ZEAMMB73_Zm00001d047480 [Zea mays]
MEAALMHQTAATVPARWRCVGDASRAGRGQQLAGVVRLGAARRAASGALPVLRGSRLPGPVRALVSESESEAAAERAADGAVRLFVGLPADAVVSDGRGVSRSRAVSAALRALKLLGVDGVELPVSWAAVQPGSGAWFEWAGYRAVAAMVRDAGLDLRVSLRTDGDALPEWVADAAAADPDVLFTDRSGRRRVGCISFAVDELPVLVGRSPLQAYEAFFRSFAEEFNDLLGSTVTRPVNRFHPIHHKQLERRPNEDFHDCFDSSQKFRNAYNDKVVKRKFIKQDFLGNTYNGACVGKYDRNSCRKRNAYHFGGEKTRKNDTNKDRSKRLRCPLEQDQRQQVECNEMRNDSREGNVEMTRLVCQDGAKRNFNQKKNATAPASSDSTKCDGKNILSPKCSKTIASSHTPNLSEGSNDMDPKSDNYVDGCTERGILQHIPVTHTERNIQLKISDNFTQSEAFRRDCLILWRERQLRKDSAAKADNIVKPDQQQTAQRSKMSTGRRVGSGGSAASSCSKSDNKDDSAPECSDQFSGATSSDKLQKFGEGRANKKLEQTIKFPSNSKCNKRPQDATAEKVLKCSLKLLSEADPLEIAQPKGKEKLVDRRQDVTVSLGPNGELRYPPYPPGNQGADGYAGIGELQCYDKYMLARLKRHAELSGQPLWGLSGPHDGPRYDESPETSAFFREPGGSWKSAYGEFFLSWYAGELLAHGDRVLAAASRAFGGKPVELSAKVPLMRGPSPADATAGLYGGYSPVAEMFARHRCAVIASGVEARPDAAAEGRLARVKAACAEHGARLAAESAPLSVARGGASAGSPGVVWLSAGRTRPCQFTYQRMGAEFFSPGHWPLFVQFVRALECPEEAHEDDLPVSAGGGERLTVPSASAPTSEATRTREVQTV